MPLRSRHVFFGICALLFAASATVTIIWSISMPGRDMPGTGLAMPGAMAMRMPDQHWPGAAVSFLAMWMVMMAAMMIPSLAPALWRCREAAGAAHPNRLIVLAGGGYFFVWLLFGMAVFLLALAFSALQMHWPALTRAIPVAVAELAVVAGLLQFTPWKAYHLACCRGEHGAPRPADAAGAWRQGLWLGLHCSFSSIGPTIILLAVGMMDLRAMALATTAVTAERLAPDGERVARLIGIILVAAGLFLLVRAAG